jgi:hypothetical protein
MTLRPYNKTKPKDFVNPNSTNQESCCFDDSIPKFYLRLDDLEKDRIEPLEETSKELMVNYPIMKTEIIELHSKFVILAILQLLFFLIVGVIILKFNN